MGHPILSLQMLLLLLLLLACHVIEYHRTSCGRLPETPHRTSSSVNMPDNSTADSSPVTSGGTQHGSTVQYFIKTNTRSYTLANDHMSSSQVNSLQTLSSPASATTTATTTAVASHKLGLHYRAALPTAQSHVSHNPVPVSYSLAPHGTYTTHDHITVSPQSRTDSLLAGVSTSPHALFPNPSVPSTTQDSPGQMEVTLNQEVIDVTRSSPGDEGDRHGPSRQTIDTLYIGGLFELSGKYFENGYSELDAALLAVSHINQQQYLPGYRLQLLYNDSKCDPGVGTDAFFDFIYRKSKDASLTMVMGSACTEVTKTIAEIVPYWNLILISYAATAPALSEREKYRTFFRLALGDSALNPARRMLIKHFRWDKVAALYEDLESMSLAFNGINKDFSSHGIVIKFSTSFKDPALELPGQLKDIKGLDVRIIMAGFSESAARQVFCETLSTSALPNNHMAYKQGMYGARYVWILVGGHKRQWWQDARDDDVACAPSQLAEAVEGAFTVVDFNGLLEGSRLVANTASKDFLDAYVKANGSQPLSSYATCSYDTVWTMARTIRHTIQQWEKNGTAPRLHQLSYDNMVSVRETFIHTMEHLEFLGVSGPVSFKGSDREGIGVVYQIQGGNLTQVAIHQPSSTSLDFDCDLCSQILWQGGRVPKDEQVIVPRLKTIERYVFYTSTCLCVSGIIMAVTFLTYNLYHGRLKFIKLSSPKLNNVAVIGCILVYLAVVIMGLDDSILTQQAFPVVCSTRAFLLAAGFSLAFGAMFAKTFRVHQIFTRTQHGLVKSKLLQDTHLLVIIGVLLAVDSVLIFAWVIVDPMGRQVTNITRQVSAADEDLIYQEQLATCHSAHLQKWLGAFYAYKGLLLIFGVYMAWETRHVKIPALNDSRYIGLNVYNVVIMSVSVVVISNILSSQPTLVYAMEAAFMLLSTTVTLCLLFLPKIYVIVTSGGNPVIASLGIVVDNSNTRRFLFDDTKEIYYRAEVQNRVYKRELVELDQQIARLERLLEIPLHPYPMLTEELLYLLPESSVDCTPRCHRRCKAQPHSCNSFPASQPSVLFDLAESEDLVMDIAFDPLTLKLPQTHKRHSSVEPPKCSNSPLDRLSRSLSIGACNSRTRQRKKGRAQTKLPILYHPSDFNFINSGCQTEAEDSQQVCAMSHIHSSHTRSPSSTSYLDVRNCNWSMISRHDKITQTGHESPMKEPHQVVPVSATRRISSSSSPCGADTSKDLAQAGSSGRHTVTYSGQAESSFCDMPQKGQSRTATSAAVGNIHAEAADEDTVWVHQGTVGIQKASSKSSSNLYTNVASQVSSTREYNLVNYSSTPVLTHGPQDDHQVATCPGCQWMLNTDSSSGRSRSASTPTVTPRSLDQVLSSSPSSTTSTTNVSSPPPPLLYPLCLKHHVAPSDNQPASLSPHQCSHKTRPVSADPTQVGDLEPARRKTSSSHSIPLISLHPDQTDLSTNPQVTQYHQYHPVSSVCPHSDQTDVSTNHQVTQYHPVSSVCPHPDQTDLSTNHHVTQYHPVSSVCPHTPSLLSIPDTFLQLHSPTTLRPDIRQQTFLSPEDRHNSRQRTVRSSLRVQRRQKIEKLQDDLVRIQKELQDLKDLEYENC